MPLDKGSHDFASMLAQIADAVREIIMAHDSSREATPISAHSYRADIKVQPQNGYPANSGAAGQIVVMINGYSHIASAEEGTPREPRWSTHIHSEEAHAQSSGKLYSEALLGRRARVVSEADHVGGATRRDC
jgi:hypothetical protein